MRRVRPFAFYFWASRMIFLFCADLSCAVLFSSLPILRSLCLGYKYFFLQYLFFSCLLYVGYVCAEAARHRGVWRAHHPASPQPTGQVNPPRIKQKMHSLGVDYC